MGKNQRHERKNTDLPAYQVSRATAEWSALFDFTLKYQAQSTRSQAGHTESDDALALLLSVCPSDDFSLGGRSRSGRKPGSI